MARCDEGYPCAICGFHVDAITESGLYLRYVLGEVPLERLHLEPERHIRCETELAQYIVDSGFPAIRCEGPFDKAGLDADYVSERERQVTMAWRRLQELPTLGMPVTEYPLAVR